MITPDKDSAQVKFPPPFVGLATLLAAAVTKWVVDVPFLPCIVWGIVGPAFMAGGIFILFTSIKAFKARKTNIPPWMPTSVIVTDGLYRFTRNPIYLAFMMIALGGILLTNNAVALVFLVPLFCFLNFYVIPKEELYLLGKFPREYGEYLKNTRRWL